MITGVAEIFTGMLGCMYTVARLLDGRRERGALLPLHLELADDAHEGGAAGGAVAVLKGFWFFMEGGGEEAVVCRGATPGPIW
jgi:hypothetical protein